MKNPWRVLRGQEQLWIVFWLYCVVGMIAVVWLIPNVDTAVRLMWLPLEAFFAIGIFKILYVLWAHLSLWTCAFNTQRRGWGYAARTYLGALTVTFIVWQYVLPTPQTSELEIRLIE